MIIETAGLILFGTWLATKIVDKGFDNIYSKLTTSDEINNKFHDAVEVTSQLLLKKYPSILGSRIEYIFRSEEVFSELIKLLFKNSIINPKILAKYLDINTLPKNFIYEFVNELKKELKKDRDLDEILANKEIFIILQGLGQDIKNISQNSTLTKKEILMIRELLEQRLGEVFSFEAFMKSYTTNAVHNLSQVDFIGLGVDISIKRKRKNLQDVFIQPNFKIITKKYLKKKLENKDMKYFFEAEREIVTYSELFDHSHKLVILGNPGSGKSVLVKSIICAILEKSKNDFKNKEIIKTLPFRIELRKYLTFKKLEKGSILRYLCSLLEEEYSINNITTSILTGILKKEKCFIFFDGLDEIFRIQDKIAIKNDIENFHNMYENIRSLTTSRIIGYDEAKLKEGSFCEFKILSFNDNQIKEYLAKWYEKEEENLEIRQREISGFLTKKHEIDQELLTNPLLLSLIVILYRNILKLPESKLEIYQSCTRTLVDKWDASKDLVIDLDENIYKNKEKILAGLAYWQYEQLSGKSIVITYDKARRTVSLMLREKLGITDEFNSDDLAESFMSYAQKRSIYFDNNFTHKTFLEYYTAYWIYSNIEKKHKIKERDKIITKYIDNSFWHIVLELLLNMIDKDQADSEIMDNLLNVQINQKISSLPFILSTISSFKNISNLVLSNAINSSIDTLLKNPKSNNLNAKIHLKDTLESQIFKGLKGLYYNISDANTLIREKLVKNEVDLQDLSELNYILYFELDSIRKLESNKESTLKISNNELFISTIKINPYLFQLNIYYYNQSRSDYLESITDFIYNFGVEKLFKTNEAVFDSFTMGPFISYYLNNQTKKENIDSIENNLKYLESKGLLKKNIIAYLKKEDIFFILGEDFKSVINRLKTEDNKEIIAILLLMLVKEIEFPHFRHRNQEFNIEEIVNSEKENILLVKILKTKGIKNKIKIIDNFLK